MLLLPPRRPIALGVAALGLLCTVAVRADPAVTDQYPEDDYYQEAFSVVPAHVVVRDVRGRPIKGAEVLAYSEDFGVRFPTADSVVALTDERGTATFLVMKGHCSFFAGAGREYAGQHPGEGYFLALPNQAVAGETTVVLQAARETAVLLPAEANEVYAMEADHIPLLALPFCGQSKDGRISFFSNQGVTVRALFVRYPADGAGYLLCSQFSADEARVTVDARVVHRISFTATGPDDLPGKVTVGMAFPQLVQDYRRVWQLIAFQVDGHADMYVTPMTINYYYLYSSGGCSYYFNRRSADLTANGTTEEQFGGPLKAKLLVSNDFTCQEATNIRLLASDRYGNILDHYQKEGQAQTISVNLSDEAGDTFYSENWVHKGDSLALRVQKAYPVADALFYKVSWNLGVFGEFHLGGKLLSDDTKYGWAQIHTAEFDGYFPFGYEAQGKQALDRLESAYAFMTDYVGHPFPTKLRVCTPGAAATAGGAGGDCIWMWLDGFLWYNPSDQCNNWEACLFHELGHHMESFTAASGAPLSGMRNEALASLLAFEALTALSGEAQTGPYKAAGLQWFSTAHAENHWLPKHLCGEFPPGSPNYDVFMIRFPLMVYLPKFYGVDVHRRFFRNWVNCRKLLKDFTEEEAFVTTYSFLCSRNLANLFQVIGYKVPPGRVYDALRVLELNGYSEVGRPGQEQPSAGPAAGS